MSLRSPGDLGTVVGPDAPAPVAEAARLCDEQVEQGLAVRASLVSTPVRRTRSWNRALSPLHRAQHVVVSRAPRRCCSSSCRLRRGTRPSSPAISAMTAVGGRPSRAHPLPDAVRTPCLAGLTGRAARTSTPVPYSCSRYSVTFIDRGGRPRARPHHLRVLGRELVHHDAAVLAVADLRDQWRDAVAAEVRGVEPLRLVVRLHLADQLGVAALRLDDRDDAGALAGRVACNQPVRHVRSPRPPPSERLDGVLLHQHPLDSHTPAASARTRRRRRGGSAGASPAARSPARGPARPSRRRAAKWCCQARTCSFGSPAPAWTARRRAPTSYPATRRASVQARVAGDRRRRVDHVAAPIWRRPYSSAPE